MVVTRFAPRPALILLALVLAGCGSDNKAADAPPTTTSITPTTIVRATIVPTTIVATTAPATVASGTTAKATAAAATTTAVTTAGAQTSTVAASTTALTAPPTTMPPPPACPGIAAIPAGVTTGDQIVGNVDGDGVDDTVTAYTSGDGVPHVFLQRGGSGGSDVAVPIGPSESVSISFEDFDAALGAAVAPPLVVLAIGAGPAGSAFATFLSPDATVAHCLQRWQLDSMPFTFTIDQRGPFSGLLCDHAAGHVYYVLRTATPDGAGNVVTTAQQINHNGATVTLVPAGDLTIPDDASVQHKFGDIQECDHPPLFP